MAAWEAYTNVFKSSSDSSRTRYRISRSFVLMAAIRSRGTVRPAQGGIVVRFISSRWGKAKTGFTNLGSAVENSTFRA